MEHKEAISELCQIIRMIKRRFGFCGRRNHPFSARSLVPPDVPPRLLGINKKCLLFCLKNVLGKNFTQFLHTHGSTRLQESLVLSPFTPLQHAELPRLAGASSLLENVKNA